MCVAGWREFERNTKRKSVCRIHTSMSTDARTHKSNGTQQVVHFGIRSKQGATTRLVSVPPANGILKCSWCCGWKQCEYVPLHNVSHFHVRAYVMCARARGCRVFRAVWYARKLPTVCARTSNSSIESTLAVCQRDGTGVCLFKPVEYRKHLLL